MTIGIRGTVTKASTAPWRTKALTDRAMMLDNEIQM